MLFCERYKVERMFWGQAAHGGAQGPGFPVASLWLLLRNIQTSSGFCLLSTGAPEVSPSFCLES